MENNLTLQLEILDKNHLLIDAILMENLNTQELTLSRAKSLHWPSAKPVLPSGLESDHHIMIFKVFYLSLSLNLRVLQISIEWELIKQVN